LTVGVRGFAILRDFFFLLLLYNPTVLEWIAAVNYTRPG